MAEGLQQAFGGSSGTSQVGLVQIPFAPTAPAAGSLLQPGTWIAQTVLATKLEASSVEAQIDPTSSRVNLRGSAKVKAATVLEAADTIMTLPAPLRPGKAITGLAFASTAPTLGEIEVSTAGVVKLTAGTFAAGAVLSFDGVSFPLSA